MESTPQTPAIDLVEKERIKERNVRDLTHVILGAGFALLVTAQSLHETNAALPWIALTSAILWSVLFGINFYKKNWIFAFMDGLILASMFNMAFVNMPH